MKALILAVIVSFAALSANAGVDGKKKVSPNAAINNAVMSASFKDSLVTDILTYQEYTNDEKPLAPNLKFKGEKITVQFVNVDGVVLYVYAKNKNFDKVQITVTASDEELANRDPHHNVDIYAKVKAFKNGKIVEEGMVKLFSVEIWEVWEANRPVEKVKSNDVPLGDPHAIYE